MDVKTLRKTILESAQDVVLSRGREVMPTVFAVMGNGDMEIILVDYGESRDEAMRKVKAYLVDRDVQIAGLVAEGYMARIDKEDHELVEKIHRGQIGPRDLPHKEVLTLSIESPKSNLLFTSYEVVGPVGQPRSIGEVVVEVDEADAGWELMQNRFGLFDRVAPTVN